MTPDIIPLVKAIRRLEEGWARYEQDRSDTQIRDGLIQRFEFTYELGHKMLKRALIALSPSPDIIDQMPFADLIRTANRQNLLLGDWPVWRGYRDMRARTSYSYDEAVALEVVKGIPAFITEICHLRDMLRQHLA